MEKGLAGCAFARATLTTVELRSASAADLPHLAAIAASLQVRPERHIPRLGMDANDIQAELEELTWQPISAVAAASGDGDPDDIVGWLIGDVDEEMGRVWWIGPFVRADDWQSIASELLAEARRRLPSNVAEEEMAVDARFADFEPWVAERGFHADPGSWALTLEGDLMAPADTHEIAYRSMSDSDHDDVARIHDEQFPGSHTTGARLIAQHDVERPRLVVVGGGRVLGYVAVEKEPDGSGYIDFVGVEPTQRRRGLGGGLIRAGVAALKALDAEPVHLTVREDLAGARELYASLGFTEECLIRPFRRGFTLR